MKKILKIVSSVKGNNSFSIKLSDAIIDKLLASHPGSQVTTLDLTKEMLPHLEGQHVAAFFTPADARTEEHKENVKNSDRTIQLLMDADFVVIGAPMYNFSIPSTLKSWIDHISRAGITFSYADGTPKGLVTNKKVFLAIASGGVYSEGPMKSYDFIEPYLRTTLGFYGMTDVTTFRVEGTNMPQALETALPKALKQVNEFAY